MTTITKSVEPMLFSVQDGESSVGRFLVLLGSGLWMLALILPAMHGMGSPLDGGGDGVGPLRYGIECLVESLGMGWFLPWAWPIVAAHILVFYTPILLVRRVQPRRWVKVTMVCVPPTAMVSTTLCSDEILVGGWIWLISLALVSCGFLSVCQQADSRLKRSASHSETSGRKTRPPLQAVGLFTALLHLIVIIPIVAAVIAIPLITGPPGTGSGFESEERASFLAVQSKEIQSEAQDSEWLHSSRLFEIEELLPSDGMVDVMQVVVPPRLEELNKKFAQAASQDPGWLLGHIRNAPPREILPYDARLGLSKEEYDEYLTLSMTLRKVMTAKIRIERDDSRITFDGDDILGDLKDIQLDAYAGTVHTPFGEASQRLDFTASEGQRITGPWDGISWKRKPGPETTVGDQAEVVFALGRLAKNARGMLYYRVRESGRPHPVVLTVLQYDLPTAPKARSSHEPTSTRKSGCNTVTGVIGAFFPRKEPVAMGTLAWLPVASRPPPLERHTHVLFAHASVHAPSKGLPGLDSDAEATPFF